MTLDQLTDLLATRVRARYDMGGGVFYLDLRAKPLGNRPPLVLRDHAAPGWPARGAALPAPPKADAKAFAAAEAAARAYVRRHYAPYIHDLVHGVGPGGAPGSPTVAAAIEAYIADAPAKLGESNSTVKNRRSLLRAHVVPVLGAKPFAMVTADEVERCIKATTVREHIGRRRWGTKPAARGTKEYIHAALVAVWKHAFPKTPCPFREIALDDGSEKRSVREAIEAGSRAVLLKDTTGALTPDQVQRALIAATSYDQHLASDPRWRQISVANTAPVIAMQVGTGARIGELCLLRWWMIQEELGIILIPGIKGTEVRIAPLQDALRPWIARLKRLARPDGGEPDEMAFVFPTDRRRPDAKPNKRNLQRKVSHALKLAGLKIPKQLMDGKATHWARSTHISWATFATRYVEPHLLSMYVGHRNPMLMPFKQRSAFGGMTEHYIRVFAQEMPRKHRQYIRGLPSPTQVDKALPTFTPVPQPWEERCTKRKPRTPEDATEQKARLEKLRADHRRKR